MKQKICFFLIFIYLWSSNCFSVTVTIDARKLVYLFGSEAYLYKSIPNNRKGSAPLITCDTIRLVADWCIDETCTPIVTEAINPGDIIFVNRHLLDEFMTHVNPHIHVPYILITGDSDHDSIVIPTHTELLENPYLVCWASINCINFQHPKAIPLPLGVLPIKDNKQIYEQALSLSINKQKTLFCIVNFVDSWTHSDRLRVMMDLKNFSFITFLPRVTLKKYLQNLSDSCFCICPRGCGWDCYRNWEALLLGSIPILEHSILDPLFYNLPVIIVDDYKLLNEKDLKDQFVKMKSQSYNYEKLYSHYWTNFLLSIREKLRNGHTVDQDILIFKEKTYGLYSLKK